MKHAFPFGLSKEGQHVHGPPHLSTVPSAWLARATPCSAKRHGRTGRVAPWKVMETTMVRNSSREGWAGVDREDSQDEVLTHGHALHLVGEWAPAANFL